MPNPLKEPKYLDSEIKFVYSKKSNTEILLKPVQTEIKFTKIIKKNTSIIPKERDLHPLLAKFAYEKLDQTYVKTIHHERSSQSAYQSWVHPDIVGVSFPFIKYHGEVIDLANQLGYLGESMVKLSAFELKRELTFSNLRESFFQTVSNASWANFSYLVTAQLPDQPDFLHELQRLSQGFQVGVVLLRVDNPSKSKVIFPANFKNQLDWQTLNKLAEENPDFRKFLYCVNRDVRARKIYQDDYDSIK